MKILFFIAALTLFVNAQDKNVIVTDERSGKPMLLGFSTREALSDTSFAWWFDSEYENYTLDTASLENFEVNPEEVAIIIIMGTWCSDSRREIPRFYKILDYLEYPSEQVTLIGVDRDKKGIEGEVSDLNIELVPTFIFLIGDEEIGRIIESPKESLEQDLIEILGE